MAEAIRNPSVVPDRFEYTNGKVSKIDGHELIGVSDANLIDAVAAHVVDHHTHQDIRNKIDEACDISVEGDTLIITSLGG